jgi:hypothetical protein
MVDAILEARVILPGVNRTRRRQPALLGNGVNDISRQASPSGGCVSANSWSCEKLPALKVSYGKRGREIAVW